MPNGFELNMTNCKKKWSCLGTIGPRRIYFFTYVTLYRSQFKLFSYVKDFKQMSQFFKATMTCFSVGKLYFEEVISESHPKKTTNSYTTETANHQNHHHPSDCPQFTTKEKRTPE